MDITHFVYPFMQDTFFGGGGCVACGILVPRPGILPEPRAVEARSLNHWTARAVPWTLFSNKMLRFHV